MRVFTRIGLAVVFCSMVYASAARADVIPYPNAGTENIVTYSFTALNTGPITAYFAGSSASFVNTLGLNINGVSTGVFGLNNHSSALGASLVLGNATAGDSLVFVMRNTDRGLGDVFSDATMNGTYDGGASHNHVYSTPYTSTVPIIDSIPVGTYVAFEDLPNNNHGFTSNWNYDDEDFVFTNVAVTQSVPLPAAVWGGIVLMVGMVGWRRLRCKVA